MTNPPKRDTCNDMAVYLRKGNTNPHPDWVVSWQEFLAEQGHYQGPADGEFDNATYEATRAFQRAEGIGVDGKVGPGTTTAAEARGYQAPWIFRGPPIDYSATRWLEIAREELGTKEVEGDGPQKSNARIEQYHGATQGGEAPDDVAWCASFVCWCLERAGLESTNSKWAKSYRNWGDAIETSELGPGAIVVFTRSRGGHVGFYVGGNPETGHILVLGGNQNNSVSLKSYKTDRVIAYRWPENQPRPSAEQVRIALARPAGRADAENWA